MGQEANQIRQEIENTRAEMTETVREITRRADVPERVRSVVHKGSEKLLGSRDAGEEAQAEAGQRMGSLKRMLRQHTVMGIAASFAAGMFAGMLLVMSSRRRSLER